MSTDKARRKASGCSTRVMDRGQPISVTWDGLIKGTLLFLQDWRGNFQVQELPKDAL